ncbi:MAG: bactofilin family protein [Verrucomicrobiota bacterium]
MLYGVIAYDAPLCGMKNLSQAFDSSENSIVSEGLKMSGDLAFRKPAMMNGKLKGRIFSDEKIIIGKKGVVEGNVVCGAGEIHGKIKGNLQANGMVVIIGQVNGNVAAHGIEIVPKARFKGALAIGGEETQLNSLWKGLKVWGHRILKK